MQHRQKRWNFRKAIWDKFSASTENNSPVIPRYGIPVDEAYSRFTSAMPKACILLRCKWPFGPFAFNKLID